MPNPESIADHGDVRAAGSIFRGTERPALRHTGTEQTKEIDSDPGDADHVRIARIRQVETAAECIRRDVREGGRRLAPQNDLRRGHS